ncbi:PKD repeat protein [Kitasatospora paracochleata]|uniref:PKD repeat protein n=1 Tax=Kitasatospora paracochleata TaxID=58354 RepID=A0ABT1IZE0_9ACTN|nr:PKD repeat protein [Kitasatospora paracochleata]
MSIVRLRQSAALTVAAVTSLLALPAAAPSAAADTTTLYVNNRSATCTDIGAGTEAQPYCTISAAANAVLPGQTVRVASAGKTYRESVHLTHSGTPEQPITFVGVALPPYPLPYQFPTVIPAVASDSALTLAGVHDVVVRGFSFNNPLTAEAGAVVTVTDSARVTVDRSSIGKPTAGIAITGASDHVTVSRDLFSSSGGVTVGAGVHDSLITANDFNRTKSAAVTVTDAPGIAVTNNTIAFSCRESVKIDGASAGALVENNVITADHPGQSGTCTTAADRGETEISVSTASTAGSKVDYNTVHPWADASAYTWAGTTYPTATAFHTATGQAAHDADLDLAFTTPFWFGGNGLPASAAAAIDSADPTAPGVDTDRIGVKPGDDPAVANTAPGGGVRDRGAYELTGQDSVAVATAGADVTSAQGPAPFTAKLTAAAVNDWGVAQADYFFDFGDGSEPVHSPTPTVTHVYATPGTYQVNVLATDAQGGRVYGQSAGRVVVNQPGELTTDLTVGVDSGLILTVDPAARSPWVIAKEDIDFGDGTHRAFSGAGATSHQYNAPGTYIVTVTVTDESGRTVVSTKTVEATNASYTAALQPGERVQLLGGTAGGLEYSGANYTGKVWAPFLPVPQGGASFEPKDVMSMASATTADQYLRAFVLVNGKIYSAERNLGPASGGVAQGQWLPWKEVSGTGSLAGISQISAASIGNSTHLVAVAGGRVYEASSDRATGMWSAWGDVTAATGIPAGVTSVAAGTTGNALHIAILGSDGHLRVADGDYTKGRWSYGDVTAAYGSPAWMTAVAAAPTPGSRFHVVVLAGGRVHETTGDYAQGYWTGWGDISAASGLSGINGVAAASTGNSLRLFTLDRFGIVSNINGDYTAGQWSAAAQVPGSPVFGPQSVIAAAGL